MSGAGGLRASGRWHRRGLPIVYLAETAAGALLEACVHTSSNDVPPQYTLLAIAVGDQALIETLDVALLSTDWTKQLERTREIGSEWLESRRSALLRVPSALIPETWNVLLNPLHSRATEVRIEASYNWPFDSRIKG